MAQLKTADCLSPTQLNRSESITNTVVDMGNQEDEVDEQKKNMGESSKVGSKLSLRCDKCDYKTAELRLSKAKKRLARHMSSHTEEKKIPPAGESSSQRGGIGQIEAENCQPQAPTALLSASCLKLDQLPTSTHTAAYIDMSGQQEGAVGATLADILDNVSRSDTALDRTIPHNANHVEDGDSTGMDESPHLLKVETNIGANNTTGTARLPQVPSLCVTQHQPSLEAQPGQLHQLAAAPSDSSLPLQDSSESLPAYPQVQSRNTIVPSGSQSINTAGDSIKNQPSLDRTLNNVVAAKIITTEAVHLFPSNQSDHGLLLLARPTRHVVDKMISRSRCGGKELPHHLDIFLKILQQCLWVPILDRLEQGRLQIYNYMLLYNVIMRQNHNISN